MAKKTGLTKMPQASKLLGVAHYDPQAEEVLPEPKVKVTKIRGDGVEIEVRNPDRVPLMLEKYPGSRVVLKK